MVENIKERIEAIQVLCLAANKLISKWGSDEQKAAEKALWQAIGNMEKEAGPGLQPGKLVKFAQADNYARYIVEKVGKKTCKLVHLDYMDGYRSPAVSAKGDCWTDEVKGRIEWEENMRRIFAAHREKAVASA